MVPLVVIGELPIVNVEFGVEAATEVTVPLVLERHVPLYERQPPVIFKPFAKVDVAEVPVSERYGVERPLAMVEVAFESNVVVAVPF